MELKTDMKILIVGDGKVGMTLTEYLSKEGYDIVVIDKDPDVINSVVNDYDVMGVCGNGASYDVLKEAEANKADILIAATSSDEINILSCLTARKLGAKYTIARVRNPEYSNQLLFMKDELGLSMVVNPEYETAREISRMLRSPGTISRDYFSKGRVELAEIKVKEDCILSGQSLASINKKHDIKILVCAVQRDQDVIIPDGNFVLKSGDKIHVTATPAELDNFLNLIGAIRKKIKRVLIVGGGKITYYLAHMLEEIGIAMKIIERDHGRCVELSNDLGKAEIICGDGSDQKLLLEEGIDQMDALVALTGIDEENIVLSMYASSLGLNKVITKVNHNSFIGLLANAGLESFVSPKFIVANRIISYVRAMKNASGSSGVQTLYKIVNNQVEALEFKVRENNKLTDITLKDLKLKPNLLIAGIVRDNKLIIPGGNDVIQKGDSVIVVTTNQYLGELEDILL